MEIRITEMTPVLQVNNMKESLDYYQKIGFTIDWLWPENATPENADHASVSLGTGHTDQTESDYTGSDHTTSGHSDSEHSNNGHSDFHVHIQLSLSDNTPVKNSGWLYLSIEEEPDQLFEFFEKRGALIVSEPEDYPWGMREFNIKDVNGHLFRFGRPTAEFLD